MCAAWQRELARVPRNALLKRGSLEDANAVLSAYRQRYAAIIELESIVLETRRADGRIQPIK